MMLMPVNVPVPVLVRVTDCEAVESPTCSLPNARLVAERVAIAALPVPLRETLCVDPLTLPELSVTVNVAV